jgi:hypothetical protein
VITGRKACRSPTKGRRGVEGIGFETSTGPQGLEECSRVYSASLNCLNTSDVICLSGEKLMLARYFSHHLLGIPNCVFQVHYLSKFKQV